MSLKNDDIYGYVHAWYECAYHFTLIMCLVSYEKWVHGEKYLNNTQLPYQDCRPNKLIDMPLVLIAQISVDWLDLVALVDDTMRERERERLHS